MDVYLLKEAYQDFELLCLASAKPNFDGLVLGHKRGHRFIVEKILSTQHGFFSSFKNYCLLEQRLGEKIIGFFSFSFEKKKLSKILKPFAYGKIFLEARRNPAEKTSLRSYLIEYQREFFLLPIPINISEIRGRNEKRFE